MDLVGPACLTFERGRTGHLQMIAIEAAIDYRFVHRDGHPIVEFSLEGFDDEEPISGRGLATIEHDELRGHLYFHFGDDSTFVARRS